MKFILPILAIASLTASSQSKINISGLQQLESICSKTLSRAAEAPIVETLVKMNEDWNADILSQFDAEEVLQVSDNIIIIRIPADKLIEFSKNDAVSYVEYGVEYQAELDFARPGSFVSDVQAGFSYDGAEVSYKGRGVVTGLMDVGIDPNHVNFTDAEGKCRVKAAYDYNNNISATSTTAMKRFTTDNTKETHGTHVAGIMAGSYNGTGSYYYIEEANSSTQIQGSERIPYYGVATESSIVMAGGALSNTNILKGIKASIDYAKRVNQPVVVNLSLGTNQGAHDGSSVFDESIATYGQQGIICISAGNDGDMPMFAGKTFTTDDCTLRTVIKGNKFAGVDIWSNSSEPLTVSLCTLAGTKLTPVASVSTAPATSTTDDNFAKYANGTVKLTSEINSRNKRFHVLMSGAFTECTRTVVIQVEGKAGQQVYLYGLSGNVNGNDEYTCFTNNNKSGYTDGTTDGTISDMACADNIIAVGSYNTRITWPTFSRVGRYIGFSVGDVSPFSSFGEKYQGVQLPVICAPGANIISSLNSHYTDNLSESALKSSTSASAEPTIKTNPTNYWGPMQGTSMSCPYVSGTVALWLEADPTLTVDEVIDILKTTAIAPPATASELVKKQWGCGKLDALAGIKEVLRRKSNSGIGNVMADGTGYVIEPTGRGVYNVMVDGAASLSAHVYNVQGVAVAEARAQGNELTIDASGVANGVYILVIEAPNMSPISKKIALQ